MVFGLSSSDRRRVSFPPAVLSRIHILLADNSVCRHLVVDLQQTFLDTETSLPLNMRNHDRHRSRSPQAGSTRHRSRSPGRRHDGKREKAESNSQAHSHSQSHSHSHSRRKHDHIPRGGTAPLKLPLNARQLVKQDLSQFRAMFGLYLDLQKNKDIYAMTEDEVKGRWKSFIGKWYVIVPNL